MGGILIAFCVRLGIRTPTSRKQSQRETLDGYVSHLVCVRRPDNAEAAIQESLFSPKHNAYRSRIGACTLRSLASSHATLAGFNV